MQISVSNLTQLTIPDLAAFDLDPGLGLACLQVEGDNIAVFLNGKLTRSWRQGGHWKPRAIKWLSSEEVITYPDVAVVSARSWRDLERSGPHIFVIAERFMLLGYGEEQIYGAYLDDPESKWASVYSRSGKLEFGFRELFYANREANIAEIEACYSVGDTFIFVADDLHFDRGLDLGRGHPDLSQHHNAVRSCHCPRHDWATKKKPTPSSTIGTSVSIILICRRSNSRSSTSSPRLQSRAASRPSRRPSSRRASIRPRSRCSRMRGAASSSATPRKPRCSNFPTGIKPRLGGCSPRRKG